MMPTLTEIADAAWGPDMPDWVKVLLRECVRTSQAHVARELGRSGAVINHVLRNNYKADTSRFEERVRGVYMDGKVDCPVLGSLETHKCQDWRDQLQNFALRGPTGQRMYRACAVCPRNKKEPIE